MRAPALLAALSVLAIAGEARAEEEPPVEAANGAADCRALRDRNEQELQLYEKRQPPVPYQYPRPNNVVNAPWGDFFRMFWMRLLAAARLSASGSLPNSRTASSLRGTRSSRSRFDPGYLILNRQPR